MWVAQPKTAFSVAILLQTHAPTLFTAQQHLSELTGKPTYM